MEERGESIQTEEEVREKKTYIINQSIYLFNYQSIRTINQNNQLELYTQTLQHSIQASHLVRQVRSQINQKSNNESADRR